MSLTAQEMKWLLKYQSAKDTVQGALDVIDDPEGLSFLLSPSKYATVIGALTTSIENRQKLGNSLGSDSNHAHRLQVEKNALATLTAAHNEELKLQSDLAKAQAQVEAQKQHAQHLKQQQLGAMKAPGAFPTLAQAQQMGFKAPQAQPKPVVKQPFAWGKPN